MANSVSFEGHPLHPGNGVPIFIAAGVLKDASQLEPFLKITDPNVAPVITSGGWTMNEWAGNATSKHPTDWVYYPNRKMMGNARGLPNSGLEGMKRLKPVLRGLTDLGIKTIIQVTNLPSEKPLDVIPQLAEAAAELGPIAVEVNLSCPNGLDAAGNLEPPICNNPEVSEEVASETRQRLGEDVIFGVKDAPHAVSIEAGVDSLAVIRFVRAVNPYINYLTGINTIGGQSFPEIVCAGGKGGMSGPVVAPVAHEWLRIARATLDENIPILSCGGIDKENIDTELHLRLQMGAMLVGGAQEFFRKIPEQVAYQWTSAVI